MLILFRPLRLFGMKYLEYSFKYLFIHISLIHSLTIVFLFVSNVVSFALLSSRLHVKTEKVCVERREKRSEKKTKKKLQPLSAAHDYRPAYGWRDKEEDRRIEGQSEREKDKRRVSKRDAACARVISSYEQKTKTKPATKSQKRP